MSHEGYYANCGLWSAFLNVQNIYCHVMSTGVKACTSSLYIMFKNDVLITRRCIILIVVYFQKTGIGILWMCVLEFFECVFWWKPQRDWCQLWFIFKRYRNSTMFKTTIVMFCKYGWGKLLNPIQAIHMMIDLQQVQNWISRIINDVDVRLISRPALCAIFNSCVHIFILVLY